MFDDFFDDDNKSDELLLNCDSEHGCQLIDTHRFGDVLGAADVDRIKYSSQFKQNKLSTVSHLFVNCTNGDHHITVGNYRPCTDHWKVLGSGTAGTVLASRDNPNVVMKLVNGYENYIQPELRGAMLIYDMMVTNALSVQMQGYNKLFTKPLAYHIDGDSGLFLYESCMHSSLDKNNFAMLRDMSWDDLRFNVMLPVVDMFISMANVGLTNLDVYARNLCYSTSSKDIIGIDYDQVQLLGNNEVDVCLQTLMSLFLWKNAVTNSNSDRFELWTRLNPGYVKMWQQVFSQGYYAGFNNARDLLNKALDVTRDKGRTRNARRSLLDNVWETDDVNDKGIFGLLSPAGSDETTVNFERVLMTIDDSLLNLKYHKTLVDLRNSLL